MHLFLGEVDPPLRHINMVVLKVIPVAIANLALVRQKSVLDTKLAPTVPAVNSRKNSPSTNLEETVRYPTQSRNMVLRDLLIRPQRSTKIEASLPHLGQEETTFPPYHLGWFITHEDINVS